jgi:hypothetical protein
MMRKLLLLSIMIVVAVCQATASERTIVKPESIYQNMLALLRTDSVIINDTATVFYLHIAKRDENAIFFSHETCLRDMKGRTYPLRQMISDNTIHLDEPRTFDDIGKNVFEVQFVFPPLPVDVTEVDMIDPLFYNQGIFGMRLDGNPLPPSQLPQEIEGRMKEIMAQQDTLPNMDFRFGWATIKGHLMDYRPNMCSQMTLVFRQPNSSPHQYGDTLCAQVSPTGDFTFRIPVAHITPVSLTFEPYQRGKGIVYVGPDTETEVYFNMREINYRYMNNKPNSSTILYITKGPLAQLANELNEHLFFYNIDFIVKYFANIFTDKEEWERYKEIQAMQPTKQLELRMAELDSMKVDEQWSPAMKELVRLCWQIQTAIRVFTFPPKELENEAYESPKAKEKLIAWQRDAVVAELESLERLVKEPKMIYCPNLSDLLDFSIRVNTLLPPFIEREKTVWKLQDRMSREFMLLDSDEIAETLANLPPAYQQWLLAWQDIFREEYNRLDGKVIVGDTLQGIPDSLVFQTLCERYRGHTIFVSFWRGVNPTFLNHVILPLQHELADLDIVWVNVYNSNLNLKSKYAGWENANWLRYFTKLQGEHYYYKMSSRMDWIKNFNKTMGISNALDAYCIVSPDGRIVRNSDSKPIPIWLMGYQDYLGIRHCLLQTASPRN